jgi:hypothetical protein
MHVTHRSRSIRLARASSDDRTRRPNDRDDRPTERTIALVRDLVLVGRTRAVAAARARLASARPTDRAREIGTAMKRS